MSPARCLFLTAAILAPTCLSAQEPRIGVSFNLLAPVGAYRESTYAPTHALAYPQRETYDLGLGAQVTASFPLETRTAIRLNFSGSTTNGRNTMYGEPDVNLQHSMFSIGAEMQFFSSNAYRHRGVYLFAGVCADFERFGRSYGEVDYDDTDATRKSRLGGTFGIGRSLGFDSGIRLTLEAAYHKTLTGADRQAGDPPATDFFKLSIGWVF